LAPTFFPLHILLAELYTDIGAWEAVRRQARRARSNVRCPRSRAECPGRGVNEVSEFIGSAVRGFDFRSFIDILIVGSIAYWLLSLIQGTTAVALLRGIAVVFIVGSLAANVLGPFRPRLAAAETPSRAPRRHPHPLSAGAAARAGGDRPVPAR
jgi:hypothetical protein